MPTRRTSLSHPPRILGVAVSGGVLHASVAEPPGPGQPQTLQWLRDGVALPGATGPVLELAPDDADYDIGLKVSTGSGASRVTRFASAVHVRPPPPVLTGPLWDEVLDRGDGPVLVDTAPAFSGLGLRYAVNGPQGVTIDPRTGLLTLNADLPATETEITVIARNSTGEAQARFRFVIEDDPEAEMAPDELLPGLWRLESAGEAGLFRVRFAAPPGAAMPTGYRIDGGRVYAMPPDGLIETPGDGLHRVSLRDPSGAWSEERAAVPMAAPVAPAFSDPPELPAAAAPGTVLRPGCGLCTAEPPAVLSYRWFRDDFPMVDETGPDYHVSPEDVGHRVGVVVIAQNSAGEAREATETRIVPEDTSGPDAPAVWQTRFEGSEDLANWRTTHRQVIVEPVEGAMRVRAVNDVPGKAKTHAYIDLLVTPGGRYRMAAQGVAKSSGATWEFLAGTPSDPGANSSIGGSGGKPRIEIESVLTMGPRQNLLRISLRGGTFKDRWFDYGALSLTALEGAAPPDPVPAEGGTATMVGDPATYYIDPEGGDDARDGRSPDTAWKSYPVSILPGTTLIQKGGTRYREPIYLSGGREDAPVILDGNSEGRWGEGRAILDGSHRQTGWSPLPGGRYETAWPKGKSAPDLPVYQNDILLVCAQLPAPQDPFRPRQPSDFALADAMTATTITAKAWFETRFRVPSTLAQGAFVRVWGQGNAVHTLRVVGYDADRGRLTFDNPKGVFKPYDQDDRLRFAVVNHPDCLQAPGQWIRSPDGSSLIVRPLGDVDPETVRIDVPRLSGGIRCTGDHVTIRHMHITKLEGGNAIEATTANQTGVRIEACRIDTASVYAGIFLENNRGARVLGNDVSDIALGRGIFLSGCSDSVVRGNRSDQVGGTQLSLYGCRNCVVMGNSIGRRAKPHSNGMSFYMGNEGLIIVGNVVRMHSGAGLVMQDSRGPNLLACNDIVTRSGYSVAFWRSARRISNPQGGHFVANNTILSRTDNRAFLYQSASEKAGSTYINNIVDGTNAGWDIRHDLREGILSARLLSGGTGYKVKDTISPVGGEGSAAVFEVLAVDSQGGVTRINKRHPGAYTTLPSPLGNIVFEGDESTGRNARFALTAGPVAHQLNTGNLILQFRQGYGLSMTNHRVLGNVAGPPPQRARLLRAISKQTALADWDPRPTEAAKTVLAEGHVWQLLIDPALVLDFPPQGLSVSHIGRYRPDGSDLFDWAGPAPG